MDEIDSESMKFNEQNEQEPTPKRVIFRDFLPIYFNYDLFIEV
jgi:hypothetical protein